MKRTALAVLLASALGAACRRGACAADDVRVGVNLPLSGALATYGKSTIEGVRMRADEINAAGGIGGRQIKLVVEDNTGDPTAAANSYNKLAGSDRVVAVVGPITSTATLAIRRAAAKLKVPVVSPTATNDKVTQGHGYVFRACFNDSFQGRVIADHVVKEAKTAATLTDMNSDYSKGLARSFAEAFAKKGGKVVAQEKYQQKDTDFGAQLRKIKDSGAEVVFVPGYPPEVPLIIKQAKAVGLPARLCGADGWDNDTVINGSGDHVEGSLIVGAFSPDDQRPQVRAFLSAYQKRTGGRPGTFEALGYDTMSLVAEALKKGASAEAVQAGLKSISGFEAVTGAISIDEQGDAVKSAVVLRIAKQGAAYATKYVATVSP